MPIYVYRARDTARSCPFCVQDFDWLQPMSAPPLAVCPKCGAPVAKQIAAPAVGASKAGLDDRAKSAGFHKLKRLGKGEYEKQY